MNGSESPLAVKWVQKAESPAGPRAVSLARQSDIRMRGAPLHTLQGHGLPPAPHQFNPHRLAGPCLCSRCPCLRERSKRSHRTCFSILFPEKWANSQLQSLGEFPVWESGNCQEWKAAASQRGLCCHWPKQQQKPPQPPPPPQQNVPRGPRHTQTRPQNQTRGPRLQGGASGPCIPAGGTSFGPEPRQPHSQPPDHLSACSARGPRANEEQMQATGKQSHRRQWEKVARALTETDQKSREIQTESLPRSPTALRAGLRADGGYRRGWGDAVMQGWRLAVCGDASVVQLRRPALFTL